MKISKWVDMGQEVEIDIDVDDIHSALAEAFSNITEDRLGEEKPTTRDVLRVFNTIAQFLKAITDEQIAGMAPVPAGVVATFLDLQAQRYKTTEAAAKGKP